MKTAQGSIPIVILALFFIGGLAPRPAFSQEVFFERSVSDHQEPVKIHGYEATIGITFRQQAFFVSEGSGEDNTIAIITDNFEPFPELLFSFPLHPFSKEYAGGQLVSRTGYYWKFSYNRFSLDRQSDPDTGGLGGSPDYNYGTRVEGEFFAVAPVFANETLRQDGSVPFRIELGLGLGYLDMAGDIVLGDWKGDPLAPKTDIDFSGPALFLFMMGRHYRGRFTFGYQMGTSWAHSPAYGYQHGYLSLDIGYTVRF